MDVYDTALALLLGYLAAGIVFAAAFVPFGIRRVDAGAAGSGIAFRLLIVPGTALLWPVLARRWLRARRTRGSR